MTVCVCVGVSLYEGLTRPFVYLSSQDFQRAESFPFKDEKKDLLRCLSMKLLIVLPYLIKKNAHNVFFSEMLFVI